MARARIRNNATDTVLAPQKEEMPALTEPWSTLLRDIAEAISMRKPMAIR